MRQSLSAYGNRIASGSEDGVVKLWSAPQTEPKVLGAGWGGVMFSPDGNRIAATTQKDTKIYDSFTGDELQSIGEIRYCRVSWSDDMRYLAGGGSVWDFASRTAIRSKQRGQYSDIVLSPDGETYVDSGTIGGITVGSTRENEILRVLPWESGYTSTFDITTAAISRDGKWVAGGYFNRTGKTWNHEWLKIWNLETGEQVRVLDCFVEGTMRVKFSPDGRYIAAAIGHYVDSPSSEVRIWEVETWSLFRRLRMQQDIRSISFSPDSRRLVTVGRAKKPRMADVKIWDFHTGVEVWNLPNSWTDTKPGGPSCFDAAFSPDGRYLALVGTNNKLLLYDGTPLAETPAYQPLADEP